MNNTKGIKKSLASHSERFFSMTFNSVNSMWDDIKTIEPRHDKNNSVPSEDLDQPGHPPSLVRVFAVRMEKPWVLIYPLSAQRRLWSAWADAKTEDSDQPGRVPRLIWVFAGRTVTLLVLSCRGSTIDQVIKVWFDFCFTALQHILGHFGHGQLT